jgi:hypothetical protein
VEYARKSSARERQTSESHYLRLFDLLVDYAVCHVAMIIWIC